ncbi:MAG: uS17 family ribosomal protein [Patescibacteria group bacterium]
MKKYQGTVVSTKNKNTAIIEVARFKVHPIYEKRFKRTKRYPVHTEVEVKIGQTIGFVETKPYSRTKKWVIMEGAK